MKAIYFIRVFLVVSFIAVISNSCSKDDTPNAAGGDPPTQEISGSIVDVGLVNSDVRQMNVSMSKTSFQLLSPAKETVLLVGNLNVAFHSVEDFRIPIGDYLFSNVPDGAPFTFHSADIQLIEDGSQYLSPIEIIDGKVTVTQNDPVYVFEYTFQLSNGDYIQGMFSGAMSYNDEHQI